MEPKAPPSTTTNTEESPNQARPVAETHAFPSEEFGGSGKPDPTRYGDWEIGGKCVDF